jgi:hypothetical protein
MQLGIRIHLVTWLRMCGNLSIRSLCVFKYSASIEALRTPKPLNLFTLCIAVLPRVLVFKHPWTQGLSHIRLRLGH